MLEQICGIEGPQLYPLEEKKKQELKEKGQDVG